MNNTILIHVAILDDDVFDSKKVQDYFVSCSNENITYACTLFQEVDEAFYQFDLYFIDIEMPSISGFDVIKELNQINPNAIVALYSHRNDLVFESFKLGCFFFIRKDHFVEDMDEAKLRFEEHFLSSKQCYMYHQGNQIIPLFYDEIQFVEKIYHQIYIHCTRKRVLIERKSLSDLTYEIYDENFIQCHQSFFVNMQHVKQIDGNDMIVDDQRIPISRRYMKLVKKSYMNYLMRKI